MAYVADRREKWAAAQSSNTYWMLLDATVIQQAWKTKHHTLWCVEATARPLCRAVETSAVNARRLPPATAAGPSPPLPPRAASPGAVQRRSHPAPPRAGAASRPEPLAQPPSAAPSHLGRRRSCLAPCHTPPRMVLIRRERNEEKERKKATGRDKKEEGEKERKKKGKWKRKIGC
jgi:hypothetical protein